VQDLDQNLKKRNFPVALRVNPRGGKEPLPPASSTVTAHAMLSDPSPNIFDASPPPPTLYRCAIGQLGIGEFNVAEHSSHTYCYLVFHHPLTLSFQA